MSEKSKKSKLILGHAGEVHNDAVTLDVDPNHNPDVVHDLNITPYPFESDQFETIISHHVLEHLENLPPVMNELHRICAPSGIIHIEVPHHSSWMAHIPEHKLKFSYFAFEGYIDEGEKNWLLVQRFRCLGQEITFHRRFRCLFLHKLFNRFPLEYERFWTYIFPAEHLKLTLQPIK